MHGQPVEYATIWQRRNLVLIRLPPSDTEASEAYLSQLDRELPALSGLETECVVTRDPVAGIGCPGVLVADRWGEIVYVAAGLSVGGLAQPAELVEWVRYVQNRCPECEGEAR